MKKAPPFFAAAVISAARLALPLSLLLLPFGVLAQNQGAQNAAANGTQVQVRCGPRDLKDNRPNDLRTALQQQRQKCDDVPETNAVGRHLSSQEKAQLREQLRQQR